MAREPLRKYQTELSRYGLGKAGLGFNPMQQRSPFAEEGPATAFTKGTPTDKQIQSMVSRTGLSPLEVAKKLGIGSMPVAEDVGSMSELEEAYQQVVEAGRPAPSSTLPSVDDILAADPSVFALEGPEQLSPELRRPKPEVRSPDDAIEQVRQQAAAQTAEDFRAEEAKIAEGMMPEMGADSQNVQKALDETFAGAMDDFINSVRGAGPDKKERTLDEYKKEFAEATGVDISGKVDKSSALMALGLALMQNRAGSGFNVGRILSAVGKAGSAALPALEKAKEKAQTAVLAAGKYALESRSSDRAKDEAADLAGKKRGKYWVYKKGGKGTEFANFDDGEFVDLNPFELNKLIENKDFAGQYEFIDASDRMSILEKRAEGVDLGDMWSEYERVSLIGGKADDVPPELQVLAAAADANYKGLTPTAFKIAEKPETIVRRFGELQQSINSGAAKFEELISAIDSGVSIPEQMVSTVFTAMRNLGIDVGDQPTDITKARTMLKEIAVREATNILQESGKTLSDNDRKRVEQLVGEISFASGDAELIKKKLKEIYNLTVLKPQQNLDRAVSWMEDNAGIKFTPTQSDVPTSQEELDAMNAAFGTSFTMDDFNQSGA
jgi:hypothetical protein